MPDRSKIYTAAAPADRATRDEDKALSRAAGPAKKQKAQPAGGDDDAKKKAAAEQKEREAAEEKRRNAKLNEKLGLVASKRYEFKDERGRSSWIEVGSATAIFLDASKKPFLTLKFDTLREILVTTGDTFQDATASYKTSSAFREHLVNEYYAYFRRSNGNPLAKSEIGSGRFRYELTEQHLAASVWNELEHVAWKLGQKEFESLLSNLSDKDPGMECYGTTMVNVFKARGLLPPSIERGAFEKQYAGIVSKLPKSYAHHVSQGGGGGAAETKDILRRLNDELSALDWARFTGMQGGKASVQILMTEKEIAKEVSKGYTVFVGVPGHYKAAISGSEGNLEFDDPLGFWGHRLYGNKRASFGVVIV